MTHRYRWGHAARGALLRAVILLGALALPAEGEAQQRQLRLVSSPDALSGGYEARQETIVSAQFSVDGFNTEFRYRFSAGGAGDAWNRAMAGPAGSTLRYTLRFSDAESGVDPEITDQPYTGHIRGNSGPIAVQFEMAVAAGQVVPAGSYQDSLTLTVLDTTGRVVDERVIPVTVMMPQVVGVSVVDPGGSFDPAGATAVLDFGVLVPGSRHSGSLDLVVRTNSNYAVRIQSMHRGVLAMTTLSDGSVIPYVLEIDGIPRDLSGGFAEVATGSGPTTEAGDRYALHFDVGPVGGVTSGEYEDNLTVIVTAQ